MSSSLAMENTLNPIPAKDNKGNLSLKYIPKNRTEKVEDEELEKIRILPSGNFVILSSNLKLNIHKAYSFTSSSYIPFIFYPNKNLLGKEIFSWQISWENVSKNQS